MHTKRSARTAKESNGHRKRKTEEGAQTEGKTREKEGQQGQTGEHRQTDIRRDRQCDRQMDRHSSFPNCNARTNAVFSFFPPLFLISPSLLLKNTTLPLFLHDEPPFLFFFTSLSLPDRAIESWKSGPFFFPFFFSFFFSFFLFFPMQDPHNSDDFVEIAFKPCNKLTLPLT